MSNLGNLVSTLICDASGYTDGTDKARGGNKALGGSIDALIGQLERQKKALTQSTITPLHGSTLSLAAQGTQQNILNTAAKGAGEGSIDRALQLNQEVDALKQKAAAERDAQAAMEAEIAVARQGIAAGESLVATLQREKAEFGMTANEIQTYRAAQAGATNADIQAALAIQEEIGALRDRAAAEAQAQAAMNADIAVARQGIAAGESLVGTLQQEKAEFGMTANQIQVYRAAQAGATEADIRLAQAIQKDIAAKQADADATAAATAKTQAAKQAGESLVATLEKERATYGMASSELRIYTAAQAGASAEDIKAARTIQTKIDQQIAFDRQIRRQIESQRAATAATKGQSQNAMLLTETIRGTEDAVAGFTNNGLKGMLQATTNNATQFGTLLGGMAGTYIQVGAIAALIGVSLIPVLYNWITGNKEVEESLKKLEAESQKNHEKEMARIDERRKRVNDRNDRIRENAELRGEIKQPTALGKEKPSATGEQLRAEEKRNKDEILAAQRAQQVARERQAELAQRRQALTTTQHQGQLFDESTEKQDARHAEIIKLQDAERAAIEERKKAAIDEREAKDRLGLTEKQRIKTENEERIRETNRGNAALRQAEREAEAELEEDREKAKAKKLAGQRQVASTLAATLAEISPGFGATDALAQRRKEIERYRKDGLINDDQKATLLATVVPKPDPIAGSVAANIAGSKEAYSSIMRAMRSAEQVQLQERQRKAAEDAVRVLEDIRTQIAAQDDLTTVEF
jgi:hypothetical protein